MPNRELPTIFGARTQIVGSEHWTDDEFQRWLEWDKTTAVYRSALRKALEDAGWVLWVGHWYEGGREFNGTRARHPEHTQNEQVSFERACGIQRERAPELLPTLPPPPKDLPQPKSPVFEATQLTIEPMRRLSGGIFHLGSIDEPRSE